ncbi:uncharacterized protein MELLADRAFT_111241 [Melampsora larici-populina 98AG31]|uniref:Uncharacterized protein n=1 Tax=Melampsora larici-populina (strain 98AG31 / pathotype 3-4-7) TaxID=747676 RepID=F4S2H8_MELLP|nr:uncharacterized protein MELLADRAFT_111241 [Melampsora larici-populina 98AG31]EGG01203.1 hypothetical protein MELLADRAFT_111241 [Melampsora larici-populina 98AG31]
MGINGFDSQRSNISSQNPPTPIKFTARTILLFLKSTIPCSNQIEPFTPNQPPRPLWLRTTPEPPPVYLTMSKFKKEVLGSLAREKSIGIVTVFKIKKALEVVDLQGGLRKRIEDAISNEPVDAHVCVTGKWWREFMGKVAKDSMAQAQARSAAKPTKKSSSKRQYQRR